MNLRITLAVAARVLRQLRRDPRTIALMLVVPLALLTLLWWMFDGDEAVFNSVGPPVVVGITGSPPERRVPTSA